MQISDTNIAYSGGLVILLCTISLLPFKVKSKASWILFFPVVPICVYLIRDLLMMMRIADLYMYIGIDHLIIGSFLIATITRTMRRWNKVNPLPQGDISQLAKICFMLGLAGIILNLASIAAVVIGHLAHIKLKRDEKFVGLRYAIAGLVMGYINIGFFIVAFAAA